MSGAPVRNSLIHYLPVFGCFATAIIYIAIGVIALLSFFRIVHGGADEGSLVALMDQYPAGKGIIGILLSGTISYIFWRIYEAIKDPYEYGNDLKGLSIRTGIALSTFADALIVYTIIKVLSHTGHIQQNGEPVEERAFVDTLLQIPHGQIIIILIGSIIVITAIVQLLYGITNGYRERMDAEIFSKGIRKLIPPFAWTGFISRGVILGIIGLFYIRSGILNNAKYVVNTDKAFDFIGDEISHTCFILVALGTIFYGVFTLALGIAYDCDKD